MKRIVITEIESGEAKHLLFAEFNEDRKLTDLQVFEEDGSLVDRIYIGKVEKIAANIGAAFVQCGPDLHAYLPLSSAAHPLYTAKRSRSAELSAGDELLVQVVKDPIKTKLAILSTDLSIKGICSVMETGRSGIGVSRKLSKEQAASLKELAASVIPEDLQAEIILRTNAAEVGEEIVRNDLLTQCRIYENCIRTAAHKTLYSEIYVPDPAYIQRLKGMSYAQIEQIVTDIPEVYRKLCDFCRDKLKAEQLRLYQDDRMSLKALYSLESSLQKLLSRQVWLKSGANIIIEQLETLTFIDVNSAKTDCRRKDGLLAVNKEAAQEIASQLRLRNISGMILIDFINMKPEEEEELILFFKNRLAEDPVKAQFIDITKLGLVEVTRKKVHKSLHEIL